LSKPTPVPEPSETRRLPLQDRSRQRVERILDAASQIFAEVGYEAATTEQIALRADTSIGSIYQFFPNKLALFNAIAARYLEKAREIFEHIVERASTRPWRTLIDEAVDAFAALDREPGFRAVWMNWKLSAEFLEAGQALNREFARRAESLLTAHAPDTTPAKRALIATMVVEIMSAMTFLAVRSEPRMADAIVAETKTLLKRYLAAYARRTRAPPKRRPGRR
jgi:AcrR family transcriptional regulator